MGVLSRLSSVNIDPKPQEWFDDEGRWSESFNDPESGKYIIYPMILQSN